MSPLLLRNFTSTFKKISLTTLIFFYANSFLKAQNPEIQISLTGFNEDVIADPVLNSLPSSSVTNTIDLSVNIFYTQGYSNNSVEFTNGLPVNGQYTSSTGHMFQMAPYNLNNDLRLIANQSGTLTFDPVDQRSYSTLYVAADGGDGDVHNINYTINFSDLSTETGTISVDDWFCPGCACIRN